MTTLTFVVPHAGRVVFVVKQVSPACMTIGRFSVATHSGLNRVRFNGRVHGRQLGPGTYRITARTSLGRVVRRITLVVVDGAAPTAAQLSSLRAANVCGGGTSQASPAAAGPASNGSGPPATQPLPKSISQSQPNASGLGVPHPTSSGVLATSVQDTARAIRPLLVALLALSILLLGTASLPRLAVPGPRVNDLLERHRVEIAALGAVALVAVALTFLFA